MADDEYDTGTDQHQVDESRNAGPGRRWLQLEYTEQELDELEDRLLDNLNEVGEEFDRAYDMEDNKKISHPTYRDKMLRIKDGDVTVRMTYSPTSVTGDERQGYLRTKEEIETYIFEYETSDDVSDEERQAIDEAVNDALPPESDTVNYVSRLFDRLK